MYEAVVAFNGGKHGDRRPLHSDDTLKKVLKNHIKPGRHFSRRNGEPIMRMDSSLQRVFDADPTLNEFYAYRTWSRRLGMRWCKLGIGRSRQKLDRCPICHCWDTVTSGEIYSSVDDITQCLEAQCADYFFLHSIKSVLTVDSMRMVSS